jgi:hypothetical protein
LPSACFTQSFDIAIDRHDVPFYGFKDTPGVIGGPKKKGTNHCHASVTAVIVNPHRRYTIALAPLANSRFWPAVEVLLQQIQAHNISIRTLLLDRGFFSAELVSNLTQRKIPFVVGVPKKGKRWAEVFEMPTGELRSFRWKCDQTRQWVSATMVNWRRWRGAAGRKRKRPISGAATGPVTKRGQRRQRKRSQVEVVAMAIFGVSFAEGQNRWQRALQVKRSYRKRFGIETSYRQMTQGKGWTTSGNPCWRLLLVGVALVLRNVWVSCQRAVMEANRSMGMSDRLAEKESVGLEELMEWLADALKAAHSPRLSLPTANFQG